MIDTVEYNTKTIDDLLTSESSSLTSCHVAELAFINNIEQQNNIELRT